MTRELEVPVAVLVEVLTVFKDNEIEFRATGVFQSTQTIFFNVEINNSDERGIWHEATDLIEDYYEETGKYDDDDDDDDDNDDDDDDHDENPHTARTFW